jgi:uncharacterized lipoprotein YajG
MFRLTVFTKPLVMITCLALLAGCDATSHRQRQWEWEWE